MTKSDTVIGAAVEQAREAALSIAEPGTVGDHLGMQMVEERLGTHYFVCTAPAYVGWRWAVSMARAARAKHATVCETNLVPGDDALLSPEWVPYAERLKPGDLGAGDVLPYKEDDPNLEPGFEATGDEDVDAMAIYELGLGRPRVLSAEGREVAAQRWFDGDKGPSSPVAVKAPAPCRTCGYFLPMAGALRTVFGVCANAWSPSDGNVVALDHGCGAHSEVDAPAPEPQELGEPILDDSRLEIV
ncbi:DUF3027 domain-containing protein [Actinomycetota bacterium]